MNDERDLIIIGGGPAGYTAALYAARANLQPLVIEGFAWGGQLMITSEVENYPGYSDGIMGPKMMEDFRRQAERFGTEFLSDDVTRVDFSERPFRIWVGDDEYRARSVIVATGASARQLGLESEVRLQGRGVTYCAVCDAAFYPDKDVVVVGGGDSAMEEAIFLTKFARKVSVVHRRDEFRASPIMVDRARANEKMEFVTNAVVDEVGARRAEAGFGASDVGLNDCIVGETCKVTRRLAACQFDKLIEHRAREAERDAGDAYGIKPLHGESIERTTLAPELRLIAGAAEALGDKEIVDPIGI